MLQPPCDGLKHRMRSKTWWFTAVCDSHELSHFAAFFIVVGAKISIVESRISLLLSIIWLVCLGFVGFHCLVSCYMNSLLTWERVASFLVSISSGCFSTRFFHWVSFKSSFMFHSDSHLNPHCKFKTLTPMWVLAIWNGNQIQTRCLELRWKKGIQWMGTIDCEVWLCINLFDWSKRQYDPTAGSPTVTLLRLLLPLDNKV